MLGTLERLCLELLLCQEEVSHPDPDTAGLTPCSGGWERSCSPCFFASSSASSFLVGFFLFF